MLPALLLALAVQVPDSARFAAEAQRVLASGRHAEMRWPVLADVRARAESLYQAAGWRPLWLEGDRPSRPARSLAVALHWAELRGLDPADFDGERLQLRAEDGPFADAEAAARFDLMLTLDALRFARALNVGRIAPRAAHTDLELAPQPADLQAVIGELRRTAHADSVLDALEPSAFGYLRLKQALVRYRSLARDSGLVPLPALPPRMRPGAAYAGAPALRRLLRALGDLPDSAAVPDAPGDTLYDATLVAAVQAFQRRNALAPDGIVGTSTAARLNRPFAARLRQIELTLERWRWLPRAFESPPILVNIPGFRLYAFADSGGEVRPVLQMPVVVGRAFKHETPVFSARMTYLVFSPYWEVPKSIERQEIRPAAMRNPGYLARNRMELLREGRVVPPTPEAIAAIGRSVHVRQRPGDANSLGRIKFMLPNAHAIYLHDTPSKQLFADVRRDYSHGCVRLQDPVALAEFVLRDQPEWTRERMAQAMQSDRPVTATLARRIPVLLLYGTAVATGEGQVFFHDDIYGHDRDLDQLLRRGFPFPL
ncbi:MAG TPA: L,D-transpeptidase family protein [Gemmatimonadales bacterium]|nr:L,D-transpeptidase family protein [Gemmatimonadales bacterium]